MAEYSSKRGPRARKRYIIEISSDEDSDSEDALAVQSELISRRKSPQFREVSGSQPVINLPLNAKHPALEDVATQELTDVVKQRTSDRKLRPGAARESSPCASDDDDGSTILVLRSSRPRPRQPLRRPQDSGSDNQDSQATSDATASAAADEPSLSSGPKRARRTRIVYSSDEDRSSSDTQSCAGLPALDDRFLGCRDQNCTDGAALPNNVRTESEPHICAGVAAGEIFPSESHLKLAIERLLGRTPRVFRKLRNGLCHNIRLTCQETITACEFRVNALRAVGSAEFEVTTACLQHSPACAHQILAGGRKHRDILRTLLGSSTGHGDRESSAKDPRVGESFRCLLSARKRISDFLQAEGEEHVTFSRTNPAWAYWRCRPYGNMRICRYGFVMKGSSARDSWTIYKVMLAHSLLCNHVKESVMAGAEKTRTDAARTSDRTQSIAHSKHRLSSSAAYTVALRTTGAVAAKAVPCDLEGEQTKSPYDPRPHSRDVTREIGIQAAASPPVSSSPVPITRAQYRSNLPWHECRIVSSPVDGDGDDSVPVVTKSDWLDRRKSFKQISADQDDDPLTLDVESRAMAAAVLGDDYETHCQSSRATSTWQKELSVLSDIPPPSCMPSLTHSGSSLPSSIHSVVEAEPISAADWYSHQRLPDFAYEVLEPHGYTSYRDLADKNIKPNELHALVHYLSTPAEPDEIEEDRLDVVEAFSELRRTQDAIKSEMVGSYAFMRVKRKRSPSSVGSEDGLW